MSLILEALKKSDAERQRSANDQRLAPAARHKGGNSAARLTMVLAAIAVSIAIGWYASQQSNGTEPKTLATKTDPLSSAAVIASPRPVQTSALPADPDIAADEPVKAEIETLVDSVPVDSAPVDLPQVDLTRLEQSIAVEDPTVVDLAPPSEPLLTDLDLRSSTPLAAIPDAVTGTRKSKASAMETFAQLPSALRSEIGELTLNVLVFDEQAADRFVLINLRRYEGGDQLNDRLIVTEIRADGVVLDYDGRLFLLDTHF
jgi:general secretion pathway protein B